MTSILKVDAKGEETMHNGAHVVRKTGDHVANVGGVFVDAGHHKLALPQHKVHKIDCDIEPRVPDGFFLSKHTAGRKKVDPCHVKFFRPEMKGKDMTIRQAREEFTKRISNGILLNGIVLDDWENSPYHVRKGFKNCPTFFLESEYCSLKKTDIYVRFGQRVQATHTYESGIVSIDTKFPSDGYIAYILDQRQSKRRLRVDRRMKNVFDLKS